ncbi:hypothetical protein JA116_13430 [Morganella morganii]|uniref:hypothetical protein n=1 Tax=Morganella morganii TaxID=582 RepID=UPI0015E6754A|nr:hypothetical protein CXB74_013575 [Morganella morganii]QXO48876.1 hypothetical protein JC861_13495 [Morganella morganii]QXO52739.1 hypothetical protein JC830_13490 [Morganella morganii]QXO60481.1 hypothetical protein JC826_13335 [Morganella morganii]QXO68009.1 hypothetical protein JC792_13340 [Morganella morganii]
MDISRQQFEEYIKLHTDPKELEQKLKTANNGLNYADRDIDLMWIGWQASRSALKPVGYLSATASFGLVKIAGCLKNTAHWIRTHGVLTLLPVSEKHSGCCGHTVV